MLLIALPIENVMQRSLAGSSARDPIRPEKRRGAPRAAVARKTAGFTRRPVAARQS